jgi:hypothetical protein
LWNDTAFPVASFSAGLLCDFPAQKKTFQMWNTFHNKPLHLLPIRVLRVWVCSGFFSRAIAKIASSLIRITDKHDVGRFDAR